MTLGATILGAASVGTMSLTGAVLGGGKSKRVGTDKGALVLPSGETLGARTARVLAELCSDVVVLGHGRGVPDHVPRIEDAEIERGPLGGIVALLRSGRSHLYLIVPVDMPRLEAQDLRRLVDAQGEALAACFSRDGKREPLPLLVDERASELADAALADGALRLAAFVTSLEPRSVAVEDPRILANINTLADFTALVGGKPA